MNQTPDKPWRSMDDTLNLARTIIEGHRSGVLTNVTSVNEDRLRFAEALIELTAQRPPKGPTGDRLEEIYDDIVRKPAPQGEPPRSILDPSVYDETDQHHTRSVADLIPEWYEGGTHEQMLDEAYVQIRQLERELAEMTITAARQYQEGYSRCAENVAARSATTIGETPPPALLGPVFVDGKEQKVAAPSAIAPTPMPVSRYSTGDERLEPDPKGAWVAYGDYEALERLYLQHTTQPVLYTDPSTGAQEEHSSVPTERKDIK